MIYAEAVRAPVIMIAHRLSTVVGADKIIVLEQGRIAEQGPHAQLAAAGGLYARMWADYNQAVQWKIPAKRGRNKCSVKNFSGNMPSPARA
jgi:ABC-type transport system involved in Fe-S cluster assembly, permease and ATPase components